MPYQYDCIIIGGGIAGLQAAIQLGRYTVHKVLVIDSGYGRSTLSRNYHNILGFPDGISGPELRRRGKEQALKHNIEFVEGKAVKAAKEGDGFVISLESGAQYTSATLLLATGLTDRFPPLPGLVETLGLSVYVCPDCDGYEIEGKRTVVMGSGKAGAHMALILSARTQELIYVNHEGTEIPDDLMHSLNEAGIEYIEDPIREVLTEGDGQISGLTLASGRRLDAEQGFIAFGHNHVHSELAEQLGVDLLHNKHIETNARSKMTNVEGVWAAGDIGAHSEQATVAMGEGNMSAIWIHKTLTKMKESMKS
ncbi:NAD(P)/FAD-dependent oxidoreductase [Paenibacillus sp. JX-17]|uniref:NAD(P)/FAD-dependent oxidoreductase n=1 Tax=Paenibacillus lacisoli TaxID=3064525 RepID=A0ABT9C8V2_9BACL|nr:NAD(P)/FAD-dependent oxidoreductase [Paenibacillus sp. JX-17]MDO7905690.1 NAD(P)/FAD-dependent oxidoreductase [Paenibacillus sp. JX-17]